MKVNSIIVRYGEISLKGKNRIEFEQLLNRNIRDFLRLQGHSFARTVVTRGRIYIDGIDSIPDLKKVLGIFSYSPACKIKKDYELLKKEVTNLIPEFAHKASFRVRCQRIDKKFFPNSIETERDIGAIMAMQTGLPVDLTGAEVTLNIEIGQEGIYLFFDKMAGFAGLPYGSAGKLVSLVSGGIDSPVATFMMMKRGVEPVLFHVRISDSDFAKVEKIKEKLEEYTPGRKLKLYSFSREEIFNQRFASLYENPRFHSYMCLLCKFRMHQKAGEIARIEGALGLITGDNLAQVASQTLKNMFAYRQVSGFPVYSPLIGFDKLDTINLAKEIGTFSLSSEKSISCTPPKNPKTGVSWEAFQRILHHAELL